MSYVLTVPYTELTSLSPSHEIMYSPRLPTILESRNTRGKFSFPSVVDSGADYCVFPATFGEMLGIDVRNGESTQMSGFGGSGDCFYHSLNVVVVIDRFGSSTPCTMPHEDIYFKVKYGSKIKELKWNGELCFDYSPQDEKQAGKLRDLIKLIINIVEIKPEYQNLPADNRTYA